MRDVDARGRDERTEAAVRHGSAARGRSGPQGALLAALLIGSASLGCTPARGKPPAAPAPAADPEPAGAPFASSLSAAHPLVGRVWDVRRQVAVSRRALEQAAREADYLLLGERHDNVDHHRLQADLVRIAASGPGARPAVAWEMFDTERQSDLDAYVKAHPKDARGLGEALSWSQSGWPAWETYLPIAEVALSFDLRMVAANLSRQTAKGLVFHGPSVLPAGAVARLGLDTALSPALQESLQRELQEAHCGQLPASHTDAMISAQRARDATLGESVLEGAKDGRAVLIAGAGHVRTDRGAGAWLAQRRPDKRLVAIAFVEVEDGSDAPADYAARFHADTLPFDYVWFTPRASNDDPCAAMKPKERTSSESPPKGAGATGIRSADVPRLAFEAAYAPGAFPFPEEQSRRRDAIAEQALWNDGGRGSVKWHPQPRVVIGEPSVGGGRATEKGKKKASPPRWDTIGAMRALRRFGYVGVRRCFDAALRGEGGLEGRTVVDIGVDGKGRIVSAQPSNGRVPDSRKHQTRLVPPTVRACIADALRRVAVPPAAGKRVLARVSVDVWPGDAALPVPEPAPLPGSLPPTAFSEAIAAASPALHGCFELLGKQRPDTWGRLALRLDALPDGTLSASQVGSTFPDAEVVACAASALSNVRAPVHATASRAMVAWRFHPPVESEPPRARSGETDAGAVDAASSDADLR